MSDQDLLSTPDAAHLLGVPESAFSRLVAALRLEPARAGSRTQPRLWDRATIVRLDRGPEGVELRESVLRQQQVQEIVQELTSRYPAWRTACLPAARALFNFNRYTKWTSCSLLRRRELYDLKTRMLRLFFELGFCREATLHMVAGEDVECEACEGTGEAQANTPCTSCEGRGEVPSREPLEFVHFLFEIDGATFKWHGPRRSITWPFTPTSAGTPPDWQPGRGPKPIAIDSEAESLEAEAHLLFVLEKDREEKEAARDRERQLRREQVRAEGLARQEQLRKQADP